MYIYVSLLSTSSPLVDPLLLRIAFNVEELPARPWLKAERLGLATGWFHSVAVSQLNSGQTVTVRILCCIASYARLYIELTSPARYIFGIMLVICFSISGSNLSSNSQSIPPPRWPQHPNCHDWTWYRGFPLHWVPGAQAVAVSEWQSDGEWNTQCREGMAVFWMPSSWQRLSL